jgi:hypothetical protein
MSYMYVIVTSANSRIYIYVMFDTCWLIPIIGSNKTFFSAMTRKNVVRSVSPFFDWFPYDDHEQKQEHIIIRCHPTQMGKSRWRPKWDADGAGSMKNQKIEQSVVVFFQKRSNSRIQIRIVMIYYFRFVFFKPTFCPFDALPPFTRRSLKFEAKRKMIPTMRSTCIWRPGVARTVKAKKRRIQPSVWSLGCSCLFLKSWFCLENSFSVEIKFWVFSSWPQDIISLY